MFRPLIPPPPPALLVVVVARVGHPSEKGAGPAAAAAAAAAADIGAQHLNVTVAARCPASRVSVTEPCVTSPTELRLTASLSNFFFVDV